MAKKKTGKRAIAKAEVLAWFVPAKYTAASLPSTPQDWVPLVYARAHLLTLLKHGLHEQARLQFARLQADPTADLGMDLVGTVKRDARDARSVRMLSMQVLRGLSEMADAMGEVSVDGFDAAYSAAHLQGLPGRFAHLRVDLSATKTQVKKDFAQWLASYLPRNRVTQRDYAAGLVRKWVTGKVVAYADLHIFAQLADGKIAPQDVYDLVGLRVEQGRRRDTLRFRPQKLALQEVFTLETAVALHLAAGPVRSPASRTVRK